MGFHKKIEYKQTETMVYFVDDNGLIQGTLKSYTPDKDRELREELLLYTQEYKDGLPIEEKVSYFYSV